MKKGTKVVLIILLVAAIAVGGYFIYNKFFANKMKEMEPGEGWIKYVDAWERTNGKAVYAVNYNSKKGKTKASGYITIDNAGYYHEWSGSTEGSQYIVKINSSQYGVFEDDGTAKSSSTITASEYNANYSKLKYVTNLEFLGYNEMDVSEDYILANFYAGLNVTGNGEFKEVLGELKDGYVWKTTYTCTYNDSGKTFKSTLVRNVYFENMITKVTYEMTDKELNGDGDVKKKGEKRSFEASYSIKYATNQAIVESDFNEYPSI